MGDLANKMRKQSFRDHSVSLSLFICIHTQMYTYTLCIHEKTKESIGVNIAGTSYRRHC